MRPTTADPKTRECRQDISLWSAFGEGDFSLFKDDDLAQSTSIMTDCIDHARLTPAEFRTAFHVYDRAVAESDGRRVREAHKAQAELNDDPVTLNCRALMAGWPNWKDVDMDAYTHDNLASLMYATVPCLDNANFTPSEFRFTFHVYAGAAAISSNRNHDGWQKALDGWKKADDENAGLVTKYNSLAGKYNSLLGYAQGLAFSRQFAPATSIHCTSNRVGSYVYTDCN
jgi:hypothetical protein